MELRGNDSEAAKKHAQEIIMAFASDGDADKLTEAMTHARSFLTQNQQDGTGGAGLVA
jgi:predicted lipid-binding transport protein (Tim44 family)